VEDAGSAVGFAEGFFEQRGHSVGALGLVIEVGFDFLDEIDDLFVTRFGWGDFCVAVSAVASFEELAAGDGFGV